MTEKRRVFTTFQAAKYCQVSPFTVRNWIESGALPAYRTPGGHRRILKEDLDAFLREHGMPSADLLGGGRRRVLLVDDEPEVVRFLRRIVKGLGGNIEIATAADGFEAGALVAEFVPHVVILDLKMPGVDGFEVCRRIKANPKTQGATILGVTGYYSKRSAEKFAKCGGWKLVKKPFDVDHLRRVIAEALKILPVPQKKS